VKRIKVLSTDIEEKTIEVDELKKKNDDIIKLNK